MVTLKKNLRSRAIPWTDVRYVTLKEGRRRVLRHTLVLTKDHLGIFIPGLGYLSNYDLGRKLICDADPKTKRYHSVIVD